MIIAIHEKALFDYLTLELSPAFPGDKLITVEIGKTDRLRGTGKLRHYRLSSLSAHR